MLDRTVAPSQHEINNLSLIEPTQVTCKNGLKIFIFQSLEMELIKAEFVFNNIFSEPENPLLNTCLSHLMKEGTKTRTSKQIAEQIDYLGAYLIPEYSFDHSALTLYSLQKHVTKLLPLVHDVLVNSVFPQNELDTFIRNNKQNLSISLQKNDYIARRLFYNNLFGINRYGFILSEEKYDALLQSDIQDLYQKQIQPNNCTLFLSGNISDSVLSEFLLFFEQMWESPDEPSLLTTPKLFDSYRPELIVEERPEAIQSAVRLAMPSINRTHEDFPAVQFVNTMFGGYFGSRLMRNIREEKGYTYGINSANVSLLHGGFFTLATEVGVSVTNATLNEIEGEFTNLRQTPASEDEVSLVKNYLLGSVLGSVESIFSHVDKFKSVYFHGMTLDYFNRYNDVVRSMDSESVLRIADRYFDFDKALKIVVGKLE